MHSEIIGQLLLEKCGNFFEFNFTLQIISQLFILVVAPKLYIPSTLNIDLILWSTQLIVCAENVKSWFKSWGFPFTFQAYILPHTLNCTLITLLRVPIVGPNRQYKASTAKMA